MFVRVACKIQPEDYGNFVHKIDGIGPKNIIKINEIKIRVKFL